jgi:membrane-associated phospholipid phosphatase
MPLVVLVAVASMAPRYFPNCTYDVHAIVCVLCTAIGMSEFITNFLKKYVGRLRPNFYSLCEFSIEALKCMADEETINEGRKSFPSGHSSFSFSSMGVAVFFFLGRINKVMEQGTIDVTTMASYNRRKLFMVLSYSPWLYSAFVACSRLVDNWHHASDVIAGMLIGIFTSYVSYHLWYPPISSPYSGVPIISRVGR